MRLNRHSVIACLLLTTACSGAELAQRQAEVAEAGAEVMPFDLERTTTLEVPQRRLSLEHRLETVALAAGQRERVFLSLEG